MKSSGTLTKFISNCLTILRFPNCQVLLMVTAIVLSLIGFTLCSKTRCVFNSGYIITLLIVTILPNIRHSCYLHPPFTLHSNKTVTSILDCQNRYYKLVGKLLQHCYELLCVCMTHQFHYVVCGDP